MLGTPRTRREMQEAVTAIVQRNSNDPRAIAAQMMYLLPTEELPTLDQVQELINLAYGLGWKDREASLVAEPLKQPPTVTMDYRPGVGTTFLYDGKPRP